MTISFWEGTFDMRMHFRFDRKDSSVLTIGIYKMHWRWRLLEFMHVQARNKMFGFISDPKVCIKRSQYMFS